MTEWAEYMRDWEVRRATQRIKTLRFLLWWYVLLLGFNVGLALTVSRWSAVMVVFCLGICVFAWLGMKREKSHMRSIRENSLPDSS